MDNMRINCEPLGHSRVHLNQALGGDGNKVDTPVISNRLASLSELRRQVETHLSGGETPEVQIKEEDIMEVETSRKMEQEDRASIKMGENRASVKEDKTSKKTEQEELREIEKYFTALEADRRHLQDLLQEQKEEHELELRALERQMLQERLEWESLMKEREEALLSAFISVAISKEKLKKDLSIRMNSLSPPVLGKRQPLGTAGVTCQDTSASTGENIKESDLQEIAKLEAKIRKAEMKKLKKLLKKAEKEAKKVEKKRRKEEEKKLKRMDENNNNSNLPGCTRHNVMDTEQDGKIKKGLGFFRRMRSFGRRSAAEANKLVTQQ